MATNTLIGNNVHNKQDEHLGEIKEIMLDVPTGKVPYAVFSVFFWRAFTIGEKLFAVPRNFLKLDAAIKRFVLDVNKERFEDAPGFDSDHWPNLAGRSWVDKISAYYGIASNQ